MICPLIYLAYIPRFSRTLDPAECLRDKCAWWHGAYGRCALWVIAEQVDAAAHNILVASGHEPPPLKG